MHVFKVWAKYNFLNEYFMFKIGRYLAGDLACLFENMLAIIMTGDWST